jgi:hypothetical protein
MLMVFSPSLDYYRLIIRVRFQRWNARLRAVLQRHSSGRQTQRDGGVPEPIDDEDFYYALVCAATMPSANGPVGRLLTGRDPKILNWIDAHADGLVAILLRGLATGKA